jgi:hypothetical protein
LIRNGGNVIPKHACPEAKGSNPTTELNLLWPITHSGDISITGKSHKKELGGSSKDDTEMKKVSQFKYAACYMVVMVIILSHYNK